MLVGLTALMTLIVTTFSVSVEVLVTGGPLGGWPVAVTVSVIDPLLRSAWVAVYVAEHVSVAPVPM